MKDPLHSRNVERIVDALQEAGVTIESDWSASPANATAYKIRARFQDGDLVGVTGDYWGSARGVFVWGPLAVRYVAERLHLRIGPRYETILQRFASG